MKQKILLLFLAAIASMGQLFAFSVEIDGLYYDGNVVYKTASVRFKSVSYPSGVPTYNEGWKITEANILSSITYEGVTYPVTSIGNNAFDGCTNLISVTIPNSITSIGSAAFKACQSLTSINIPNSVTSIGWDAFYGCTGLTYVIIPESVTSIGKRAFGGCTNADIVVPQSVTNIDEFAFYGTHYVVQPGVLEGCLILEGEDKEVLYKCISADVAEIIIPNSVTSIRDNAFSGCTGLTSVTIPNSVTSIGTDVFSGCTGLTNINVDADNPNYCDLDGVLFNKDRTELILYPAGKSATSYTIPNSVTSIFNDAYNGCTNLTSITIPNSVTEIGNSAFSGCTGLTSVTIGNSVSSIGDRAFYGCNIANVYFSGTFEEWLSKAWSPLSISSSYNLYVNNELIKNAIIPNSVTEIGNFAFYGCSGLTSITIPNSVTAIGNSAFSGCSGLTSVNMGNAVIGIGEGAFSGCTGLTSITLPNSVAEIGTFTFSGCSGLTSITIPNSVTSIGMYAFSECSGLKSVVWNAKECTFPNLSKFNEAPFYNNANITSFSFGSEVESIPSYLCCGMTGLTSITISNSVASIGNYAFYGCSGLSSVTIGNSVSSIGNYAFEGCTGLTSVVWNAVNCPIYNSSCPFPNQKVTSFVFGDEVEAIPGSICNGMTGLTSITIPNSVISIGDYAFYGCSGLKSISIGNSFASIGREAFVGCTGLNSVFWNAATFADFRDTTYPFPNQQVASFVFGDDVEYIPAYLCCGMTQLTSITIPESVQNISEKAFYGCTGITSIIWKARNGYASFETIAPQITSFIFGDNVNDIPRNLCQKMSKLTSITIPNSVIQISEGAFKECTSLGEINLGNSVRYIGKEAFYRCSGISTLTIPLSVNSIGESAFGECVSLREIHISDLTAWLSIYFDGVSANPLSVAWGTELFLNGTALHDIVIPNEMSYINPYVFAGCSNIVSVTFPDNLTDIGDGAFYGCSLQTLSLPNTLRSIGANAFYASCSMLTSISFPNSIETIGAGAFSGAGFASINLPNSIKNIGHGAFYHNTRIEKITIPSSLIAIGSAAFAECPNLTSVQWNASDCHLEQLKDNDWYNKSPFYNCPKLQSFSFGKNVKNIPEKLCSQIPITSIILPESITSISEEAFKGCDYLAELTIPNSVVTIKKNAFANCTDIEHIILGSGLRGIEDYAFDGCKRIEDITCYAERTPDITKYSFNNIGDKKGIPVYILENRMNAYLKDALWAEFDLQIMGATTTTTDEVKITPTEIAAVVIWPAVFGAASYELVIKDKQGNVICTLIFDANGLLTEIAFKAPGRDDAPQKTQAEGFSFTITGLDSGTEYDLTIVSKDENGDTLDEQTLSFTTEGEAPQSIDQITNDQLPITNKVLRNGQLLILHGDNTYTLTGQQVR